MVKQQICAVVCDGGSNPPRSIQNNLIYRKWFAEMKKINLNRVNRVICLYSLVFSLIFMLAALASHFLGNDFEALFWIVLSLWFFVIATHFLLIHYVLSNSSGKEPDKNKNKNMEVNKDD